MTSTADEGESRSGIQVLARAAEILRLLHGHPSGISQAEIGEQVGLARSTVSRLLMALEREGLVVSLGPRGRYRLGPELVRLAASARSNAWADLHPLLVDLSYQICETVDLSILEGDHVVFVDQVVADNRLRTVSAVGDYFPLHASANGKAILAAMPEADVKRILAGRLEAFTENTLTTPGQLRTEIETIRASGGVAIDREEQSMGICAVGAVVGTVEGEVIALSVPVPSQRFTGREAELSRAALDFLNNVENWRARNA